MIKKLLLDRPKSQFQRRILTLNQKQPKSVIRNKQQICKTSCMSDKKQDDFFDKFHQTFMVQECVQRTKNNPTKRNKTSSSQPITAKNHNNKCSTIKIKNTHNQKKQLFQLNKKDKKYQQKQVRKTWNKNKKMCESRRNTIVREQINLVVSKRDSLKKRQELQKKKVYNDNSRKFTSKKKVTGNNSTATTTLGNSAINSRDDINIARYLRLKLRAN